MISWSYSAPPWKIQGRVECKYAKVGRDLTCEADKEEGEEEEAVEMSVTEDPAGMTLPEFAEASNTDLFILFFLNVFFVCQSFLAAVWTHKGHSIDSAFFFGGTVLKTFGFSLDVNWCHVMDGYPVGRQVGTVYEAPGHPANLICFASFAVLGVVAFSPLEQRHPRPKFLYLRQIFFCSLAAAMFLEDEEELLFTIDAAGEVPKKKVRKLMIHYLSLYSIENLGSSSFAFFYSFAPLLPVPLSECFCRGGSLGSLD